MMEILVTALAGSLLGAVAGLLPAIGTLAGLIMAYPFLLDMTVYELLAFFVCLSSVSQFTGSVPAILLKIPGESSSLVAIKESNNILANNQAGDAIALTAVGSFLSGLLAAGFTYFAIQSLSSVAVTAFSNTVITTLLLLLIVLFCTNNSNSVWLNFVFIGVGLFLGIIGYNAVFDTNILGVTDDLSTGLPLYPVITGLFVVNELAKPRSHSEVMPFDIKGSLKLFSWLAWLRGTVIGYLCGFLPLAGKVIGTNLGYTLEQRVSRSSLDKLLNAESANNSAIISSLLPLLLFGIPITLGEALIFDIVQLKDFDFSMKNSFETYSAIIPAIIIANIIGLIVAWPLAKQSLVIFKLPKHVLTAFIVILLISTNYYIGTFTNQQYYYMIVLAISSMVGYALKKFDTFPLIFSFIMSGVITTSVYRFYLFNF